MLRDPCLKSKIGRLSVKQRGVQLWNKLEKAIKSADNPKAFRKKIKDTVLSYTVI